MKKLSRLITMAIIATTSMMVIDSFADNRREKNKGKDHEANCHKGGKCKGLDVFGITADQRLLCFCEAHASKAYSVGSIAGLVTDTSIVGIDFRPASGNDGDQGDLYGLGDAGGIYVLNLDTAAATFVSRLNVSLSGTSFGVDFNPTVDRLRVISDNGQDLRVNVDTGATTVDGMLNYTPGVTASGISGAAYINNDADTNTATVLFDIDSALDQVAVQLPPNNGSLSQTGKLLVDTTSKVGFDIHSKIESGTTIELRALASLVTADGLSHLYSISPLTGKATLLGDFKPANQVVGIAIPLNQ